MPVTIERSTIEKLTHESTEIRLRTLEQITAKLERAVAHNEEIQFKPGELCKQLIRWFGYQPLQAPQNALQLQLLVLRSSYGEVAIKQLGVRRFIREMDKVQRLLHNRTEELRLTEEIQELLRNHFTRKQETDLKDIMAVASTLDSDMNQSLSAMSGEEATSPCMLIECPAVDYESPWSKPATSDYNSMKTLADLFGDNTASSEEVQNALQHLQIVMADYPTEYMLQAPHVYLNLLQLYDNMGERNQYPLEDVVATLLVFLHNLKKRLRMRRNTLAHAGSPIQPESLPKTQLKISKALQLLLEKSFKQLEALQHESRKETRLIAELLMSTLEIYKLLEQCINQEALLKLHRLCVTLQEQITQDDHITLRRIKYLIFVSLLQDMVTHNAYRQPSNTLLELLEPLLRDYSFKEHFPRRHESLRALLALKLPGTQQKYEKLQRYESDFNAAAELLKNPDDPRMQGAAVIKRSAKICLALEKMQSARLTEMLFKAIIDCNSHYHGNFELLTTAKELLLKLLRLRQEPLKAIVYRRLTMTVRKHFACLMNGESYCSGIATSKLLDSQIIGVPLSSAVLLQLIHESAESQQQETKQHCEDVLVLLLRTQHLLGDDWLKLQEILMPVLPLLQCCTYSESIMQHIEQKLYDPDARNLPFLSVLQGNVCFLFHHKREQRTEAMTRLIYILNTLPEADDYVPSIMEISDTIPNDLCYLSAPREYARIFTQSAHAFGELSTMHNLLSLLETPDIQPLIRKSCWLQLNVLSQQWTLISAFCSEGAYYLPLQALENAMQRVSYEDYIDTAVPAIGILCKVLLYDAPLRRELAETPNLYVLLLRALFMFQNDIQVRQDASICLWLLVHASYVTVMGSDHVQVPSVMANLQLPLRCELQKHAQSNGAVDEYEGVFRDRHEELLYQRQLLASSFCGGASRVCQKDLDAQKSLDCAMDLKLTRRDWRLMKATVPAQNLKRFLRAMSNSTEHKSLISATISLQLQLLVNDYSLHMSDELAQELYQLLSKFLQVPPGNEADVLLYEHCLDVCDLCVRLPVPALIDDLTRALISDFQNALITLLRNTELPLRLYYKLCTLHRHLLNACIDRCPEPLAANFSIYCSNLFDLAYELASQLFKQRDLQRVRCLLRLLDLLSSTHLDMNDKLLLSHCKLFLNLSCALKSTTQTGAQWQRDCLTLICRLMLQMSQPRQTFTLNSSSLKYLGGLCGHSDQQVRALTWCILSYVAQYKANNVSGLETLQTELNYLPGGFMACCLCTLLDSHEVLVVRQLAGNLFVAFLSNAKLCQETLPLLERHGFFTMANGYLSGVCVFTRQLPLHFTQSNPTYVTNCEVMSCLCRICIRLLHADPSFLPVLCEKPFMCKLYEVLKLPPAHDNPAYYAMCADICQLYGLYYERNFEFLQRTLCHDQIWLMNFYQLLDQPDADDAVLVNLLQLLMALCKDDFAYIRFCDKFAQVPEFLIKLLLRAINVAHINSPLQRCALGVLTLLLIKSQRQSDVASKIKNFAAVLESPVEIVKPTQVTTKDAEPGSKITVMSSTVKQTLNLQASAFHLLDGDPAVSAAQCTALATSNTSANSGAVFVFIELLRVFNHLYPIKSCKFDRTPTAAQIQVCEALAVLLKCSKEAQSTAKDLRLLDKILKVFKAFLDEFKSSPTSYVRRCGETKKLAVIKNIQLLFNIQLNWFSVPSAYLTDELLALELTKVIIQLWPWLTLSSELKLLVLQVCSYYSEHSFIICQQFSTLISGCSYSLLQLSIKIVTVETNRLKPNSAESSPIISAGLRIVMNCCACTEGRISMVKSHALDIFDGLYPFNAKAPKMKPEIIGPWLQFWELFSRYPEGARPRNLNALCSVINRATPRSNTRVLCLKILRNMCFQPSNRTILIGCSDFIHTADAIITQPMSHNANLSYEEQLHVCVAIWKLISGGVKFVSMVRGTKMASHLSALREQLCLIEEEYPDRLAQQPFGANLAYILDIILDTMKNI